MSDIKIEDVSIVDLVREAVYNIPFGWKEEVWVENGKVVFSEPMTQNTFSSKDSMDSSAKNFIGNLHGLSWGEIEGFFERSDGKIELDNPYDGESRGEYYMKVNIYSVDEAIEVLADYLNNDQSEVAQLLLLIREFD